MNPKVKFDITAMDRASATVDVIQSRLKGLQGTLSTIGKLGTFGFLGNEAQQMVRQLIEVNTAFPKVHQSVEDVRTAWKGLALDVGRNGFNAALIDANTKIIGVLTNSEGLQRVITAGVVPGAKAVATAFAVADTAVELLLDNAGKLGQKMAPIMALYDNLPANVKLMVNPYGELSKLAESPAWAGLKKNLEGYGLDMSAFDDRTAASGQRLKEYRKILEGGGGSGDGAKSSSQGVVRPSNTIWDNLVSGARNYKAQIESPLDAYQRKVAELNVMEQKFLLTSGQKAQAMGLVNREYHAAAVAAANFGAAVNPMEDHVRELGGIFKYSLSDGLFRFASGTEKAGAAFKNMASSMLQSAGQLLVNKGFSTLVDLFIGQSPMQVSGQSVGGSGIMGLFDGFMAEGGKVGAGRWAIAGEAGAEVISGPATVTPMDQMGGMAFTYAPSIVIQGNADRKVIEQALRESEQRLPGLLRKLNKQGRF